MQSNDHVAALALSIILSFGLIAVLFAGVQWWIFRVWRARVETRRDQQLEALRSEIAGLRTASAGAARWAQAAEKNAKDAEALARVCEEAAKLCEEIVKNTQDNARLLEQAAVATAQSEAAARSFAESAKASAEGMGLSLESCRASADSARSSAAGAEKTAEAAAQCSEITKAIAELGRRAWVHVTDFVLTSGPRLTETALLELAVSNLGATPALGVKLATKFLVCDEIPDDLHLNPRMRKLALGPGARSVYMHSLKLSPATIADIRAGRKILMACGMAEYSDMFGVARQTGWCAHYDEANQSFVASAKHNFCI